MTQTVDRGPESPARDRIARRRVDKFAERRAQLAAAALQTLGELGYARASLREIAQNSEFSHGVLHYYFADKVDLITSSVRMYKTECVHRYDDIVASARTAENLREGFGAAMAHTLSTEAPMHRLWYDLRNQSLFEASFRQDVLQMDEALQAMIWRVVSRHAELAATTPKLASPLAYAMFDGLFQHALLRFAAGDDGAPFKLAAEAAEMLMRTVPERS